MSGTSPDIVSRAAADSDQPPLVPILLALGQALSRRRRHREAIEALRQALAEPEDKPVELLTGALLDELLVVGDPEAALKASLELAPGAPALNREEAFEVFRQLADALRRLRDSS